jgi:hypothetical protein
MAPMSTPAAVQRAPARRAGVVRRALRLEATRIREPRRIAAIAILVVTFALALAGMLARGDVAGTDAQAYWAAVRIWLEGGDPYHPLGPFLPYVYAPWMLPIFAPWALLPWEVAWFAWRGGTILALLWSIRWAYAHRPLPTAILVGLLSFPMAANLDTGNINLLLALALFGAHFTGPRVGGLIWGLATWMKWVPAPLWLVLPPRARAWGLAFLALSGLLSLLMLPLTIVQLQVLFGFGERPIRADFLVLIWAAVPWWWRLRHPFAILSPSAWAAALRVERDRAARWGRSIRLEPAATLARAGHLTLAWVRRFLGLDAPRPAGRRASGTRAAAAGTVPHVVAEIGD